MSYGAYVARSLVSAKKPWRNCRTFGGSFRIGICSGLTRCFWFTPTWTLIPYGTYRTGSAVNAIKTRWDCRTFGGSFRIGICSGLTRPCRKILRISICQLYRVRIWEILQHQNLVKMFFNPTRVLRRKSHHQYMSHRI